MRRLVVAVKGRGKEMLWKPNSFVEEDIKNPQQWIIFRDQFSQHKLLAFEQGTFSTKPRDMIDFPKEDKPKSDDYANKW